MILHLMTLWWMIILLVPCLEKVVEVPISIPLVFITLSTAEAIIGNSQEILETPQPLSIDEQNDEYLSQHISNFDCNIKSVDSLVDKRFHVLYTKRSRN